MWWRTRRHPLFLSLLLSYHITYDHTHGNISFPVNVCLLHTWYMTDKKVLPIIFCYHYKWPPTDKDDLLSMGSTHWVTYILHIKGKVCLNVIKIGNLIVKLEMLKYQTPEKVTRNEVYLETGCLTDCVLSSIIQEYDKLVCKLKTNMTPTDLSSLRL